MKSYDIVMMGHVSKDIMIYQGKEERLLGGAVVYSSAAAARSGAKVLVLTKAANTDLALLDVIKHENTTVEVIDSPKTTSIRNEYLSEDRERRIVTLLAGADPFQASDLPAVVDTKILHIAGLFFGEIPPEILPDLAKRFPLAVDAQGLLRRSEDGKLLFRDLENKAAVLSRITYLKTDAAEAEVLTGEKDREKAAKILLAYGPKEVMVTHNTEVLVLTTEGRFYRAPFTPRNLSGRTGRGDTCFASYLVRRLAMVPRKRWNTRQPSRALKWKPPAFSEALPKT